MHAKQLAALKQERDEANPRRHLIQLIHLHRNPLNDKRQSITHSVHRVKHDHG